MRKAEARRDRLKLICRFGARKMWRHLRSKGHDVARCMIEGLYAQQDWAGAVRAKAYRTTIVASIDVVFDLSLAAVRGAGD